MPVVHVSIACHVYHRHSSCRSLDYALDLIRTTLVFTASLAVTGTTAFYGRETGFYFTSHLPQLETHNRV